MRLEKIGKLATGSFAETTDCAVQIHSDNYPRIEVFALLDDFGNCLEPDADVQELADDIAETLNSEIDRRQGQGRVKRQCPKCSAYFVSGEICGCGFSGKGIQLENSVPDNPPNGRPQYYVSECPDTNRQFLVEHGEDNNIAELTMDNVDTIRRLFLCAEAKCRSDLYDFLQDEHKRYLAEIVPLRPDTEHGDDEFEHYDEAKNEFLESLWDVIQQHFDNRG